VSPLSFDPHAVIPAGLSIVQLIPTSGRIVLVAKPTVATSACPLCGQASSRVHSTYVRRLADLPWQGKRVELQVSARRFRCPVSTCRRVIFTERLPEIALPKARRTPRLTQAQRDIGLALGGEPGSRLARRLAMPVSDDTLLRLIRTAPIAAYSPPRVVGVGEWAWRRGLRYGTILVDLEHNRVLDLLPDRQADSVAAWLRRHPGVEVVARDRASVFAEGNRQGAPQARQVCDRWHLLRNLGDALRTVANRHRRAIRHAARGVAGRVHNTRPSAVLAVVGPKLARIRQANRRHREERYAEIRRLQDQGVPPKLIAPVLGMSRRSVERWLTAGGAPDHARPRGPTVLDGFQAYLERRWREGCRNAVQLHRELKEQGCTASVQTVSRWAHRRRTREPSREPVPAALTEATIAAAWKPPSGWQCAWLLTQPADQLKPEERAFVVGLATTAPDLVRAADLARTFADLVRERRADGFNAWSTAARDSALRGFADGLMRDEAAVRAALTEPWNTSPVEGQINRLKGVKRQMYGRAKHDLLRSRVLAAA
jgi:Transposase and inactivated derivatives